MSYKTEYIAGKGILVITGAGEVRYASVMQEMPDVARLMQEHHTHRALVDLRAASLHLSVPELYFLTNQLADLGVRPGSRLAFVCPKTTDNLDLYNFYALASRVKGYRSKLFEDVEKARAWLLEGARSEKDRKPG